MAAEPTKVHDVEVTPDGSVAFVILAHNDPRQVRRLIQALDPFPVFLHCDARTPPEVFRQMTEGLPARCRLLPRRSTGWASWNIVPAEIDGYRAALEQTTAQHIAVLQGSDYPLATAAEISRYLRTCAGRSIARVRVLPFQGWGRSGGFARLNYRHWGWRKYMLRLPIRRSIPADIVPAGAGVQKVLSRSHASLIVSVASSRPDLLDFWRRSWCADETFVPSILSSPVFGADWPAEHVEGSVWWIGWDGTRRKSPPWVTAAHLAEIRDFAPDSGPPKLFARKFASDINGELLDEIDVGLRSDPVRQS